MNDEAKSLEEKIVEAWVPKVEALEKYLKPASLERLREKENLLVKAKRR